MYYTPEDQYYSHNVQNNLLQAPGHQTKAVKDLCTLQKVTITFLKQIKALCIKIWVNLPKKNNKVA